MTDREIEIRENLKKRFGICLWDIDFLIEIIDELRAKSDERSAEQKV